MCIFTKSASLKKAKFETKFNVFQGPKSRYYCNNVSTTGLSAVLPTLCVIWIWQRLVMYIVGTFVSLKMFVGIVRTSKEVNRFCRKNEKHT